MRLVDTILLLTLFLGSGPALGCASGPIENVQTSEDDYQEERLEMVAWQLERREIRNPRVLESMRRVPRHLFMPKEVRPHAYADRALPIGEGQTISQPYIVALMTQVADPRPEDRVLEVGTGSGYQAAVLGEVVKEVYTIEIVPALAEWARSALSAQGYDNVFVREGDGYRGWPEQAPFDIVMVTAAAREVPQPLIDQLAEGGRLVMPVGRSTGIQRLILITRENGEIRRDFIASVRFVPMTGEAQQAPR
ncbi:MAG: protein-L-isoaspartate(D-aspartate) O-methyltransferase [Acidobacteriota bacterium]